MVALRPARPEEREFAYGVKRAAFRAYLEELSGWDDAAQRKRHERRFAAHDFRIVSAVGTDVGVVALEATPGCPRLPQLFLLPEFQNRGIGTACLALLRRHALELGLPVRVQVLKSNSRALAFYERLGFVRAGASDTHTLLELKP